VATGITPLDEILGGGWPQGRLSELVCPGRGGQSVLAQVLAHTRQSRQRLALIDAADGLAPEAHSPDHLRHLFWVRPPDLERALACLDCLVRDGNFALVWCDLRGLSPRALRRVPQTLWHRLHRVAEGQPAAVVVQTPHNLIPAVGHRVVLRLAAGLEARPRLRAELLESLPVELARGRRPWEEKLAG
jgi:hypothetical protein